MQIYIYTCTHVFFRLSGSGVLDGLEELAIKGRAKLEAW